MATKILEMYKSPKKNTWKELLSRPKLNTYELESVVLNVLDQVKNYGDEAVRKYTMEFDKIYLESFEVSTDEIKKAEAHISAELKKAISVAQNNIEKFHRYQVIPEKIIETTPGVKCWQKSLPIERVGLYIPGGSAPLFSTVLMLGIPAKIAVCPEIILCTPPDKEGNIHPAILYAAKVIGIDKVYKIGGVQAIGAMAYGTETIPAVNKIFGPGNQYVTAAKQMVNNEGIAIDLPAGPSEVAVIADDTCDPDFVASDLLSQAEHGADSQVLLITSSESVINKVEKALEKQLSKLERKEIAEKALKNSKAFLLNSNEEIIELTNEYAPEHLIISTADYTEIAGKIKNAGSVFLGNYTPESAGDYASGTNHTLPTYGFAKAYSGVNLDSFIKKITFQQIDEYGLFNIGPAIMEMAATEKLQAHKNAVGIRLGKIMNND